MREISELTLEETDAEIERLRGKKREYAGTVMPYIIEGQIIDLTRHRESLKASETEAS